MDITINNIIYYFKQLKMKLERSVPYFNALLKATSNKRISILQSFPQFVIDDLLEVLLNVVMGRVDIGNRKKVFQKHQKVLLDIANTKSKPKLRKLIYHQKGRGFLAALLPIVMSIIGARAVS
jgi:hypothetical protein